MSFKKKEISDDAPALADDPDGSVAAPAASDCGGGGPTISKRQFLRGTAVGAGSLAAGGVSLNYSTREADAIAPALVALGIGGSVAVGWALREYEVLGSDSPADGLTADALKTKVFEISQTRHSTNASSFVDNRNILDGVENTAWVQGKIAAIEAINAEKSQSEVTSAANTAVDNYFTTIKSNFLKSWNESCFELQNQISQLDSHSDVSNSNLAAVRLTAEYSGSGKPSTIDYTESDIAVVVDALTVDMPDGTTFDVHQIDFGTSNHWTPVSLDPDGGTAVDLMIEATDPSGGDSVYYLGFSEWNAILTAIEDAKTSVSDGIGLWVDNVYGDVQSGDIAVEELITPRERAQMMADGEDTAPAIADLIALNQHVDPDREATITLNNQDITLVGTFARTANPSGEPLEAGSTYDPASDLTGDVYFTYDTALGEGVWSDHETAVDGGTITFTSEPIEGVTYSIDTTAGETATVQAADFMHDDTAGVWETDISAQVDNAITEIDSVTYTQPDDAEASYETILLQEPFTIEKFVDSDGNEVDSATFEQSGEPQDDTNYITQEEWDDLEQQNQELIDKYESSQGGGGFVDGLGFGGIPGEGVLVAIVGIVLVLLGQDD